jgi:hypothetical protein
MAHGEKWLRVVEFQQPFWSLRLNQETLGHSKSLLSASKSRSIRRRSYVVGRRIPENNNAKSSERYSVPH